MEIKFKELPKSTQEVVVFDLATRLPYTTIEIWEVMKKADPMMLKEGDHLFILRSEIGEVFNEFLKHR